MKTYAGIPQELATLEEAKIVLLPVPFDATSTWGKGADKGPEAFLDASENMELYDIETQSEVYKRGVFLAPEIKEKKSPEMMVEEVHSRVREYLALGKYVSLFGGEHSISIGAIRAFGAEFEKLTILQLDAHTDLRPTYEGSPFNHACAVFEANEKYNLVQVGIRSCDVEEVQYIKPQNCFFAHEIHQNPNWIEEVLHRCEGNVYVTIDLDGFDPSIIPATGTPEPGGLQWYPTLELLKKVHQKCNVVGFDINELCPNPDSKSSNFLAAKLYYKMLTYKFEIS